MLGDPELRMYHGDYRTLSVAHPATIALSDTQPRSRSPRAANPVKNARVTAHRAGDDYRSVLTDINGVAVVPFRPDSSAAFTLTATAYSAKPYQASQHHAHGGVRLRSRRGRRRRGRRQRWRHHG